MRRTEKIQVPKNHPMFSYFTEVCKAATNLANSTLFIERQCITSYHKSDEQLSDNERNVLDSINKVAPSLKGYEDDVCDRRHFVSYYFLVKYFPYINQPDYCTETLSRQTAQHIVKNITNDIQNFWKTKAAYDENPSKFTGKPKLPHYKKSGSLSTVTFTNQDCIYKADTQSIKFPKTKLRLSCRPLPNRIKEIKVCPTHGIFVVLVSYELDDPEAEKGKPKRIIALDPGVNNTIAIANNSGLENLLFKGGVIKSINQFFNKKMAQLRSSLDKKTISEDLYREEADKLGLKRDNKINDTFHKISKQIVDYCVENDIDTIVIGKSDGWKQNSEMDHVKNQNFVPIPFTKLFGMIEYKAEAQNIRVVYQEESYTSQASFLDNDAIPVYGKISSKPRFSGRRYNRLYKTGDKTIVNSDINGAANIGRKAFPKLFPTGSVDFRNVRVIVHPDYESRKENRKHQNEHHVPSKAKLKRQRKKNASNPSWDRAL